MTKLPPEVENMLAKISQLKDGLPKFHFSKIDLSKEALQKFFEKKDPSVEDSLPTKPKFNFKVPKAFALDIRFSEIGRYFSGSVFEKAILTIDKSTLLIIGVTWLVAIIAISVAFISVKEAAALKVKTETARALDPVLPKIVRLPLNKEQYDPLLRRLKKQFPTVQLEVTGKPALKLQSNSPEEFISWLNAISYTDSMVSTIRWTMASFCVGVECGETLMQAELTAEAINITQPETVAP